MPKPATKTQLLEEIDVEWTALEEFLATLTPDEMTWSDVLGPWSVKDVLAHLTEWEQMFLCWYKAGLKGKITEMPAPGFNWMQLPQLNQHIYEKHREESLGGVLKQFRASHRQMLKTLNALNEEDIFTKKRFAWTKKLALMSYIYPNTSSHYRWARNEMQKGMKRKKRS